MNEPRRVSRGTAIASVAFSSLGLAARPAWAQAALKVTVASSITEDISPLYYAIRNGQFGRAGLDVDVVSVRGGSVAMPAVVSGTYEMARVNLLSICTAHLRNIEIAIVAPQEVYTPTSREALFQVAVDASYKTGADLNGKVVAVVSLSDIDTLAAKAWVDKNGGDSKTLKYVELPNNAMAAALVQKRVDAAVIEPPYLDTSLAEGTSKTIGDPMGAIAGTYMISAFIARTDWATAHADAVRRFNTVWNEAAAYVNTHAAETAALVADFTKTDLAVIQKMHRTLNGTALDPAYVQPIIDLGAKYGLLDRRFPARELFWSGAAR